MPYLPDQLSASPRITLVRVVVWVCLGFASLPVLASAEGATAFERTVRWPPLIDAGVELVQPWTGGLISPRPQLADLDDDGDLDLLIAQDGGVLTYYRNDGDATSFAFNFAEDDVQGIDAGSWATLADIDGDDDLDLFTDGAGVVAFYRNDGGVADPVWVLIDPSFQGIVNTGVGNTPELADVDEDGDLDYLEMEQNLGTAILYRNAGNATAPSFVFDTSEFGCIDTLTPPTELRGAASAQHGVGSGQRGVASGQHGVASGQHVASAQHGVAVISTADVDADLDLDILIGDFFNPNLWFFRDDGAPGPCYTRATAEYLPITTAGLNQVRLGDLDGDLDLDIVLGIVSGIPLDNLLYLENIGSPTVAEYELVTTQLIEMFDVGFGPLPGAGDLDGDFDHDILVGQRDGTILVLDNAGTPSVPVFEVGELLRDGVGAVISPSTTAAPELVDYEGDGDLDLFIGSQPGWVYFYRNDGSAVEPTFVLVDTQFAGVKADFEAIPALGDLDGDDDIDMLLGEFGITGTPRLYYMRNDGTSESPLWTLVSDNTPSTFVFAERVYDGNLAPDLADVDDDGDLDLVLGERAGNVNFYRNDGTPEVFDFVLVDELYGGQRLGLQVAPVMVDLDADGDLEMWVGEKSGGLNVFRSLAAPPIGVGDAPAAPPHGVPSLSRVFPNPARPFAAVRFTPGASGPVTLRVIDATGRSVRTLIDARTYDATLAPIEVSWDGRDVSGGRVASGVFFYELRTPGGIVTRKVVIVD